MSASGFDDLPRDVLSRLVGSAISSASEEYFSFGLAMTGSVPVRPDSTAAAVRRIETRVGGRPEPQVPVNSDHVRLSAQIGDLDDVVGEFRPGDEQLLDNGKPVTFGALSNTDPARRFAIATFLLDRGARVNRELDAGDGPLIVLFAARRHDFPQTRVLAERLIVAGADPAQRGDKGVTPTQLVAQFRPADEEVGDLLDWWFSLPGLDPRAPNAFGKSPLDLTPEIPHYAHRRDLMENYRG